MAVTERESDCDDAKPAVQVVLNGDILAQEALQGWQS